MRPLRIAVLFGGPSREHDVSVRTGAAVASALAGLGHRVLPIRIDRRGRWELPRVPVAGGPEDARLECATGAAAGPGAELARPPAAAMAELCEGGDTGPVDVVFVALHGPYGEDGTVQGFLETAGVPYTGSGVAASALAMDKERAKEVLCHHGLRTAPWLSVGRREWEADTAATLELVAGSLEWPVVVKPPRDGSSFGVSVAHDAETLRRAIDSAMEGPEGRVLVERRIEGTEVTCPVLGNHGGPLRALPLVEIVPKGREIFDFAAKYQGESEEICPARVAEDVAERVRAAAVTAHGVLGCDGLSRSDFIVDREGHAWYLETNTVPGMTEQSLCPLSARAAGIEFPRLCEMLAEAALRAAASRRR